MKGRLLFFASEEKKNHFTLNVVCAKNKNPSFFLNMSSISYRDVANQPISTIAIKTDCTWISVNEHSILKSVHCTETSTAWQQIPVVTRESVAKNLLQAVWFVTRLDLDRTPPHNPRVKKMCRKLAWFWSNIGSDVRKGEDRSRKKSKLNKPRC